MFSWFRNSIGKALLALIIILIAVILISTAIGSVDIPMGEVALIIISRIPLLKRFFPRPEGPSVTIVLLIRLPRAILAVITGTALAISGTSMQGIFKNQIASPYVLGVSAAGAFGASIGIFFGMPFYLIPVLAFISAIATALFVLSLGKLYGKTDIITILLAGFAMNSLLGALTGLVLYLSSPTDSMQIVAWTFGSLSGTIWREVMISLPVVIFGSVVIFAYSRALNVIQTGDESAMQMGIDVDRTKLVLLLVASLLVATVISFTGIIGFVGLVIPHAARLIIGPDHRKLIPTAALMGGVFLSLCDSLSKISGGIWIGIITGLFGAPFFIYLLVRSRGETGW